MTNLPMKLQERIAPLLTKAGNQYRHVATFDQLKWAQERHHLITLLQREPKTRLCTPESLVDCVLQAGGMGLSLNPLSRHVYIIPRRARKRKQNEDQQSYERDVPMIAYASPSYIGLIEMAVRSGRVLQMAAEVVFRGDTFHYHGPMKIPTHEAVIKAKERTCDHAVGVYACARLAHNGEASAYLDADMVQRIRQMSEIPNASMWHPAKFWTEGWKKAAIRRFWKTLPRSESMLQAESVMDRYEGIELVNEPDPLGAQPDALSVDHVTPDQISELRGMITAQGMSDDDADTWLKRLAIRSQCEDGDIAKLPAPAFNVSKQLIEMALKSRALPEGSTNAD